MCVVHLRVRKKDQMATQTFDASTSGITYWQIIDESSVVHGISSVIFNFVTITIIITTGVDDAVEHLTNRSKSTNFNPSTHQPVTIQSTDRYSVNIHSSLPFVVVAPSQSADQTFGTAFLST